jgi:short-subunit dehydrogenase
MNVILTGAGRGIGFETAKSLADKGYNVIAISRNYENLRRLTEECMGLPGKIRAIPFDIEHGVFEDLKEQFSAAGPFEILINNAGVLINKRFEEYSDQDINSLMGANFTGAVKLIKAALPFMKNPSHIVNIGSMGGYQGSIKFPGLSLYSAAKGALASLTESLALEFKEKNISVNCLALGAVDTEMLKTAFPEYKAPVTAAQMGAFISDFAITGNNFYNGKILPVSLTTP